MRRAARGLHGRQAHRRRAPAAVSSTCRPTAAPCTACRWGNETRGVPPVAVHDVIGRGPRFGGQSPPGSPLSVCQCVSVSVCQCVAADHKLSAC